MKKKRVWLAQVNHQYGRNCFLPYSVGRLQAYAQTFPEIREAYEFEGLLYVREDPVRVVRAMEGPDIVGISCYIWNWEWSQRLAQSVKAAFPRCLVVLGGPQVTPTTPDFFEGHPYVDIVVHYEGEQPFADVLRESLNPSPDFFKIPGLNVRGGGLTLKRELESDLAKFVSPYLSDVFGGLMGHPYDFQAVQETNRSCPYSCSFLRLGVGRPSEAPCV